MTDLLPRLLPPELWRADLGLTAPEKWRGRSTFDGDLATPLALVRESAVRHNVVAMADWSARHGVLLAPHAKTTMAPELFRRQLDAGAWGLTVASAAQARVALAAGASRVLIANQVVDPAGIAWLARAHAALPDRSLYCYVDSLEGVRLLDEELLQDAAPLPVLIELGYVGGRTGARSHEIAMAVAKAAAAAPRLRVAGVAGYEGGLGGSGQPAQLHEVAEFCTRLRALAEHLVTEGLTDPQTGRVVVSAGGSAFFDVVADVLTQPWPDQLSVDVVIRSGSYITWDDGLYSQIGPQVRTADSPALLPAFEVWGRVLSRPEPTRALVDVGRRDVPFDQGLPIAKWTRPRRRGPGRQLWASVEALNDQHAFLHVSADDPLGVGDWVGLGISHPCTAFDKWNAVLLVDDDDRVVDVLPTYF